MSPERREQRRGVEKRDNTKAMSDRENSEMEIEETDTRTESTSMEETEGQEDGDWRTSEADDRTDWRHKRDPRSSGEKRENARTQMRHELDQSSVHPVRTGVADCKYYLNGGCFFGRGCRFNHPPRNQMGDDTVQPMSTDKVRLGATNCEQYLQTGQCSYGSRCWFNHPPLPGARDCEQYLQTGQCSYGRKCRFNHPLTRLAPVLLERVSRPICKYFQRGGCTHGSSFQFDNSMRWDGIEPMCQARTWVRRSDERRHGTESSSRAEKKTRTIPDVSDDVVAGQNSWLQRRRARENVQRGNIDFGQRRESEEEQTLRERQAHDLEEQKQREMLEEILMIDHVQSTVQSDEGGIQTQQRLGIPENHNVNGQKNIEEQVDLEGQKREAQEKARRRNVVHLRQFLQDIGIQRKQGDGF